MGRLGGMAAAAVVVAAALFALGLELGRRKEARPAPALPADRLSLLDDTQRIAPPTPTPAKLVFHDALTQDQPPDTLPSVPPRPAPSRPAKRKNGDDRAEAARPPQPARPPVQRLTAPPPRATTAVWSTSTPLPVHGRWTVQVGASPREAEAQRLAARTPGARVVPADVDGKRWYRVRVGGFATREEAVAELDRLARVSGARGFVTTLQ